MSDLTTLSDADLTQLYQQKKQPFEAALAAEGVTGNVADIARSIYQQESSSGKNAKTSNAGAVGGMQIVPATFKSVADDDWDIKDPVQNARAGIRYVQQMSELADGDPVLTAAGYYGGPKGLEKARKGIAVSDPRNPNAPNTLEYGQQVAARVPKGVVARALDRVTDAVIPSANAASVEDEKSPLSSMSDDELKAAYEKAKGAQAEPQKRSMIDDLGRQLGLTLRAGVSGAASIPAMMSDAVTGPINAGLDKVAGEGNGFRFQPAGAALNKLMTSAGVAEPENATERVVQDVGSSMAGAGSLVKGGLAAAKYASGPVAAGIGDMLSAGAGTQLASAATGAGASGVVRENGGGAGAQLAASLLGSAAPSLAPFARDAGIRGVVRGGEAGRQRVADKLATFESAGTTPTVGQAVGGNLQRAEAILEKAPGSAGVMARRAQQQIDDMSSAVQRLSDELAPGASAVNAGEAVAKGVRTFKEGFKLTQNRLYNTLDKHIPDGTPIQVGNTEFALKELNAGIDGAPNISEFFKNAKIKGIDKALQADLELSSSGGALPYEAVKKLRTLIGNEIADNSLVADVPRSKWAALYGALSEDLGIAAKQAGPKAEQSWQWANTFTKTQLERLEQMSGVVGKDSPEKVFSAAIAGTAEGDTIVRRVITMIPKSQRREVAGAVLQRMGRATPGQQDATGGAFSSETFLTNLSKLSAPARQTIFGRTDVKGIEKRVAQFARVAEARRAGGAIFANPSGTASAGGQLVNASAMGAGLVGTFLTGNPMPLVGTLAAPLGANIMAKRLTNPESVKFLAGRTEMNQALLPSMVNAAAQANDQPQEQQADNPYAHLSDDELTAAYHAAMAPPAQSQTSIPGVEAEADPARIELSGMAQPDNVEPVEIPQQEPVSQNGTVTPPPPVNHVAAIGSAANVDEAIAAAGAAVNASQAAHQVTEAMPAPVPAQPIAPEPEPVPVSMALPPVDGVASKEPTSTWYGRRGDGYEAVGDAQMAMRSRQKAAPEMDWRVETMPSGRYRLAGYQSNQNGGDAGQGAATASFASFESTPKSDGTLAIKGDARAIIQTLLASGVPAASLMPVNGGVLVGRSQAGRVQEAIQRMNASD